MLNEKLSTSIEQLHVRTPFFGDLATLCNFIKTDKVPTAAVNFTKDAMNYYYNEDFVNSLNQKQVNYLMVHELSHLISNHQGRCEWLGLNHQKVNIASDRIINSTIEKMPGYSAKTMYERPTEDLLLIPKEYTGEWIMEDVYKWEKGEDKNSGDGKGDPNSPFDQAADGKSFDIHIKDEISQEEKEAIIKDIIKAAKNRGTVTADIEEMIGELTRVVDNPLKKIKGNLAKEIARLKVRTWARPSLIGVGKGFRRQSVSFTVVLDTSGSMFGEFEEVLSYLLLRDVQIDLIHADTEVKKVERLQSNKDVKKIKINGGGGTILQPAIDFAKKTFPSQPLVVLTDGYCDNLNVTGFKGITNIVTCGTDVSVTGAHKIVKVKK